MRTSRRVAVGCLGLLALALVGGALIVLNRDRVVATLGVQADWADATMFRLGEVMSIGAALEEEFGLTLDAGYVTSTGSRILTITCTDCDIPTETTPEALARAFAVAAIGETTKLDQIDAVEVVFRRSETPSQTGSPGPYSFTLAELTRDR